MRPRHLVTLLGFVLAAVGIATDNRIVVWCAIASLLIAFVLRLIDFKRRQTGDPP
jgi:hypothetical protein